MYVVVADVEDGVLLRLTGDLLPANHDACVRVETNAVVLNRYVALAFDSNAARLPQNDTRSVVDQRIVDEYVGAIRTAGHLYATRPNTLHG